MEEEKNKKKMILAIIGAIILVAGIVGLTIAYFRAQAESKDIVVSSKKLSIVFSDPEGSLIRASDIEPIADEDIDTLGTKKTFTIAKKDAADKDVYLRLELTDLEVSDNFKDSDLRWALYKSGSIVTEGSFVNVKSSTSLPLANNILLDSTTPEEYNLYIWIHETGVDQERLMGGSLSGKITVTGTENTQEGIVNEGKLADGMIPVVYDETNNVWVKAGGDLGWYDYSKQEWANAITISETVSNCYEWDGVLGDVTGVGYNKDTNPNVAPDGDLTYEDYQMIINYILGGGTGTFDLEDFTKRADVDGIRGIDGGDATEIQNIYSKSICNDETRMTKYTKEEILSQGPGTKINPLTIYQTYTWVPRYKYKINNTGSVALPSMIDVEFESGVTSTGVSINTSGVAKTEYYTHPSFRDGSSVYKSTPYDQSGWDKELPGFWVNKYDKSKYETKVVTGRVIIYGALADIQYLNNTGIENVNVHLIKNTEWGAIAYLSQSKYGKMGNSDFTGANKEIYINSNSYLYAGRSGGSPDAVALMTGGYTYNGISCKTHTCSGNRTILNGTGASTTGNVYGIYDMNGGARDQVMANYNNSLASSNLTSDFFTNAVEMDIDNPFLIRGGIYNEGRSAGIFSYQPSIGRFLTSTQNSYNENIYETALRRVITP